jgi:hypothetical protein
MAHLTLLQSLLPIFLVTRTFSVKRPPGEKGIAKPVAYEGALDEIQ